MVLMAVYAWPVGVDGRVSLVGTAVGDHLELGAILTEGSGSIL